MVAEHCSEEVDAPALVVTLLQACSAIDGYHALRDALPEHLNRLLKCRCVLLYQCVEESLQFVAGAVDRQHGWSASLLRVAHMNPIPCTDTLPEALAWREGRSIAIPTEHPSYLAVPLWYRHRTVGVLVALRAIEGEHKDFYAWQHNEIVAVEAVAAVIGLQLEHYHVLEQDRKRIHELSLLHNITNLLYTSLHHPGRLRDIVVQHTCTITGADLCELLLPDLSGLPAHGDLHWNATWITPELVTLLTYECKQRTGEPLLVITRPGEHDLPGSTELLAHLPAHIHTVFALPLLRQSQQTEQGESGIVGMIVAAYCQYRTIRPTERTLLHLLAHQIRTALSLYQLEEETRRLDHLASLGEMAAGVAHEVRNPLAGIKYSIQMVLQDLIEETWDIPNVTLKEDMHASMTIALKEIERLDILVHELLSFARPRRPGYVRCDLPLLIDRVLSLVHAQCVAAGVAVERQYHPIAAFWVDVLQLEQILLNLLHNAIQAMHNGGLLTVSCALHSSNTAEQWVKLVVNDTGCGIAADQQQRIFQPFFTTRAHGIGLGLSITRRLIEDHGGHIEVESHIGHGTTMTVWLPLLAHDPTSHTFVYQ